MAKQSNGGQEKTIKTTKVGDKTTETEYKRRMRCVNQN
jgi:hypothetical protein